MAKISIIYWSGTGNTEQMAELIKEGALLNNVEVIIKNVGEASIDDIKNSDIIVLGSPAMGNEVIEGSEMEPFVESILSDIKGKNLALFGSYDWGEGQWMKDWEGRMKEAGAKLLTDGLIVKGTPNSEEDKNSCIEFGKKLI